MTVQRVPSASSLQNEHGVEPFASRDVLMAALLEVHKILHTVWFVGCSGCALYGKHVEPVRTGAHSRNCLEMTILD